MKHYTSRRLPGAIMFTISLIASTGCGPREATEETPAIIIVDDETSESPDVPVCGDGVVEGDEACDDGVNDNSPGSCLDDCSADAPTTCGNGVLDPGEHCDGTQGMVSCTAIGFDGGGTSQCTTSCSLDVSTCKGLRRLPRVPGSPIGVSADNRYALYAEEQADCDENVCYADPGEPGVITSLDLVGGEVITHGEELSTISVTPIDAERFWVLAEWDRDDHHGQLQIRRYDGSGEPIVVASRVPIERLDGSHPTHLSYIDMDGIAWVVPHGGRAPEKVFVPDSYIDRFTLGPDGTTALVELDDQVVWLDLDGGRKDFATTIEAVSPDRQWAVIADYWSLEYEVVSMTDGAVLQAQSRRLERAEFAPSSNFLYVREEACTYQSRTRVVSLPDLRETLFTECGTYHSYEIPHVTEDDRWLMQSRWRDDVEQHELLFTDLDTRETFTLPYRLASRESYDKPTYAYEPSSEQLIFEAADGDQTGSSTRAHRRLELKTGELHALPTRFEGAVAEEGGWLVSTRVDDPDTWTWDRQFMRPNGESEYIARRTDWIEKVDTVPGLYVVRRAYPEGGIWYARRGVSTLEQLSDDDGYNIRTYGDFLIWDDSDGTWLTIPE